MPAKTLHPTLRTPCMGLPLKVTPPHWKVHLVASVLAVTTPYTRIGIMGTAGLSIIVLTFQSSLWGLGTGIYRTSGSLGVGRMLRGTSYHAGAEQTLLIRQNWLCLFRCFYSSFETPGWHGTETLVSSESTRDPIPPIDKGEQYHSWSTSIRDAGGIVTRQC